MGEGRNPQPPFLWRQAVRRHIRCGVRAKKARPWRGGVCPTVQRGGGGAWRQSAGVSHNAPRGGWRRGRWRRGGHRGCGRARGPVVALSRCGVPEGCGEEGSARSPGRRGGGGLARRGHAEVKWPPWGQRSAARAGPAARPRVRRAYVTALSTALESRLRPVGFCLVFSISTVGAF